MLFKTDWQEYLHRIRQREIEAIFLYLKNKHFRSGLELGAGDGYQTTLLAEHCDALISTDLNFKRIKEELKISKVLYKQCDADNLVGIFDQEQFDLIFSSNLIEHLGDPAGFLKNTKTFLMPGGYAVHVVPGRLFAAAYAILHYMNLLILAVDRFIGLFQGKKIFRGSQVFLENNISGSSMKKNSRFKNFFVPPIHGNFKSHSEEFIKFGQKEWRKLFENAGYEIASYIKGPVFSGYGFGFNRLRSLLERLGLSSEHIFIIQKT